MASAAWKSKGVRFIAIGWTGFIAENLVLSSYRDEIIQTYGDDKYHLVYNSLSSLATGSIFWGWLRHGIGKGPFVGNPGKLRILASFTISTMGLVGFSQLLPKMQMPVGFGSGDFGEANDPEIALPALGKVQLRCPIDFKHYRDEKDSDSISGLERVTRHPVLWSLGFLGLGYSLGSVCVPEIVMGVFPAIFAAVGGAHQDHRYRRGSGGELTPYKERVTSLFPFVALLSGQQSWSALCDEIKWTNAGSVLLITVPLALRKLRKFRKVMKK
jgi:uncharacterized membrane protein